MVLWQCDVRVSWRAQWLSLLIHGVAATALLLLPWPLSYTPLWLLLLSLVVFDCVCSQRRIIARQGSLALLDDYRLKWQGKEWEIQGRPSVLPGGVMLRLRNGKQSQRLWLAADSLSVREWRELRRLLFSGD
ncbi:MULTISPECIES: protein YgfX [Tenebrionibacter/Tenebrionicola group]|uniref:Protein YgfX n=2 Tax=Tenebrionibacter/Tenebrionicola group TaxID=2969848 RepID=A0A8K0V741_9ENTR|nr:MULTISPECIES: protein YgfX [Tenebrionibacter/Tenebrionicola group]MBK4716315.1 protein YgfX [Tenebrionibacter intestinalis]MBV4414526.1 protein YgfX [Tenebrionicola larvae]MBV5096727.1 protein YgfX [Tenebrionicola larvae]